MRIIDAIWTRAFGKVDGIDAEPSAPATNAPLPAPSPIDIDDRAHIADDISRDIGALLNSYRIVCEPGAPSKLQVSGGLSETMPVISSVSTEQLKLVDAETQARRLLSAVIDWNLGGRCLPYAYMVALHRVMCSDLSWHCAPWNPVASPLRRLLGGKKTYIWTKLDNGRPHRLRAYAIPVKLPAKLRDMAMAEPRFQPEARSAA
jgi:hypothetical protein